MKQLSLFFKIAILGLIVMSCNNANKKGNIITGNDSVSTNLTKNTAAQILAKPQIPVLCYHQIVDGKKSEYAVSLSTFAAHIKILADSGYHSISPAQLYDYLVFNKTLPTKPVMITFDDSRAEHAAIAAPTLEKYGFRGVFFIMTITYNKKNYMTTEQIANLAKAGHTIGMHSWDHTMATKYATPDDWVKQVDKPQAKLEKIVGKLVEYWAFPNGVNNHNADVELNKHLSLIHI